MTSTARSPQIARRHRSPALGAYLRLLAGGGDGGWLEIRYRHRDRMSRVFCGTHRLTAAADAILTLAQRTDVYCGVLLRARHAGDRDAIDSGRLVWVEIDRPDALARLDAFAHPPAMVIRSGTPGHAHAYWQLTDPVGVDELEHANRRLAHVLGADPASTDASRILRPPATRNHKHQPPTAVTLAAHRPARRYPLTRLLAGLPEIPAPTPPTQTDTGDGARSADDETLRALSTEHYVLKLTGRQTDRAGKVACPLHEDHTPSLHCYPDGTFYCFGCRAGGSIYDFAATLWQMSTKGPAFRELRQRLRDQLL